MRNKRQPKNQGLPHQTITMRHKPLSLKKIDDGIKHVVSPDEDYLQTIDYGHHLTRYDRF